MLLARRPMSTLLSRARKLLDDAVHAHATQLEPPPAKASLLHFAGETSLARWRLATDTDVGGLSVCHLEAHTAKSALWRGQTRLAADEERQRSQRNDQGREASKTGFCAIRASVEAAALSLNDFHGLCIRMRPDERHYVLNVRAETILSDARTDDLYQASLHPFLRFALSVDDSQEGGTSPMMDVRVPWGAFTLTWRGYLQGARPPAMNLNRITHLGFLLADAREGEFACELQEISAFRYDEHELIHNPHAREALRLNEERGYEDCHSG